MLIIAVSGYLYVEHRLFNLADTGWLATLTLLRILQILPGVVVLVLTFYSRTFRAQANRIFPVLLVLIGIIAALIDIRFEALGTELNFRYGAGLLIVSSFFFLGVTFWWALLCAVLIVVADVLIAGLILTPEQMPEHWIAVSYYLLLLIIGAISRYVHEYSQRDQFLMRKLLGWVAEHDALSGLANRRSHDLALRQRIAQARRDRQPLSLLLLDLDDFKAYNDTFGHPAGDALIRSFGELVAKFARRPLDQAARVGGEEFALLLYNCDNAAAQRIARQLVAALAALEVRHPRDPASRVGSASAWPRCRMVSRPSSSITTPTWRCTRPRRPARTASRSPRAGAPRLAGQPQRRGGTERVRPLPSMATKTNTASVTLRHSLDSGSSLQTSTSMRIELRPTSNVWV